MHPLAGSKSMQKRYGSVNNPIDGCPYRPQITDSNQNNLGHFKLKKAASATI